MFVWGINSNADDSSMPSIWRANEQTKYALEGYWISTYPGGGLVGRSTFLAERPKCTRPVVVFVFTGKHGNLRCRRRQRRLVIDTGPKKQCALVDHRFFSESILILSALLLPPFFERNVIIAPQIA